MTQEQAAICLQHNGLGENLELAEKTATYLDLLQEWNQRMDLTAVTGEDEMMDRHFADSLAVLKTELVRDAETLIDVGTGAGFPGMVLAMALPELQVTLMDAQEKRLKFLEAVMDQTGTKNVTLIHGRAEEWGRKKEYREQFDVAVARAVAPLNVLSELLLPFVRTGGRMVCWKGPALKQEMEAGRRAAHLLGGRLEMPVAYQIAGRDWEHYLLPVVKVQGTPKNYPRRPGMPKEKPLGL